MVQKNRAEIVVKHIVITEEDKEKGLTVNSGVVLDEDTFKADELKDILTQRNKYSGYISVDGPVVENTDNSESNGQENKEAIKEIIKTKEQIMQVLRTIIQMGKQII